MSSMVSEGLFSERILCPQAPIPRDSTYLLVQEQRVDIHRI